MSVNTSLPIVNSNFGISMVESYGLLFRHYDFQALIKLEEEFNIIPRMHIYMILKTDKVKFSDDIVISNDEIRVNLLTNKENIEIKFENDFKSSSLNYELSPNKDDIEIFTHDKVTSIKGNAFISLINNGYPAECEVIYVGRSFGTDGNRNVFDRLKSHSTLQRIYAEKEDDKSIFLSSWNFERNSISFISPLEPDENKSINTFMKLLEMSENPYDMIRKKHEINFTEAALIRYFQPKYNDIMKYRFPSKTHTEYSDLFKEDVDYVTFEMDTKRLNIKLFSDVIEPKYRHSPLYDLKGKRSKNDFFRCI